MKLGGLVAFVIALAPTWATAQAQEGHSADIYIAPPEITLRGYITPNSVKALEADLQKHPDITTLRVTSGGGDVNQAIDLTDFVRSHHLSVLVDGYCLSACAHVLFAGSVNHSVTEGSIVAFHYTEAVFAYIRRVRGQPEPPGVGSSLARLEDAYRRWGLNPTLLTAPFANLGLKCLTVKPEAAGGIGYRTTAAFWVPSELQLPAYGILGPVGSWPKTVNEAAPGLRALGQDHKDIAREVVRFGGTPPTLASVVRSSRECPSDASPPARSGAPQSANPELSGRASAG